MSEEINDPNEEEITPELTPELSPEDGVSDGSGEVITRVSVNVLRLVSRLCFLCDLRTSSSSNRRWI